jgi:hypothetical protein
MNPARTFGSRRLRRLLAHPLDLFHRTDGVRACWPLRHFFESVGASLHTALNFTTPITNAAFSITHHNFKEEPLSKY